MKDVTFKLTAKSTGKTQTVVKTKDFEFIVDEPQSMGGQNMGPSPVEYVLGALSGCLNVVSYIVAAEMGITINSLSFELEGDLNSAKLFGRSDEQRAGYKEIRVKIIADVDCDAATKLQWITAVKARCPVSDNISNETPVRIKIV